MRHLAEAHAGDPELRQVAAGAPVDGVAVAQPNGGGVARQLLQADARLLTGLVAAVQVDELLLQLGSLDAVPLDDHGALVVARDLALLRHCCSLTLFAEVDVLADHGVVLLQHDAVGVVAPVLAGHVRVPGPGGRLELDDRPDVLLARHQIFSPRARMLATTLSMPRASIVFMPLVETVSVTVRFSD